MSTPTWAVPGCGRMPVGVFSVQSGVSISGGGVPDRIKLGDLDGDGDPDVIIGVEFEADP